MIEVDRLENGRFRKGHVLVAGSEKGWFKKGHELNVGRERNDMVSNNWGRQFKKGRFHQNWKGDDVKYQALHSWIVRNKPRPDVCEICKLKRKLELSNKQHNVYVRDVDAFQWVCRSCHRKYDGITFPHIRGRRIENEK